MSHDCHTISCIRPCVLSPACFTNPLAPETGDLVTHRYASIAIAAPRSRRGLRTIHAPYSPFLRFSFPARLSPESRPQGRLFTSINFSTISSVILIRRPPHRERMRERSAQTGRSDAGAFCTSFWMTRLLNLLDSFRRNSDCSDFNPPGSTQERSPRSFWYSVTIPHRSGVLISAPGLLCVAQEATGVL